MRNAYLRLGCFLTGHNYQMVSHSSELSKKSVLKYTSALFLILMVWGFIGYSFASRYLHLEVFGSICTAFVMMFMILQVERIIILSPKVKGWSAVFRIVLAVVMAILGSFIMDQIVFKDDVELEREKRMDQMVADALKIKDSEISGQISRFDLAIDSLDKRITKLNIDLANNPVVRTRLSSNSFTRDSLGKMVLSGTGSQDHVVESPIRRQIDQLVIDKSYNERKRDSLYANRDRINTEKETQIRSKTGFLDELQTLKNVVTSSYLGIVAWLLFFLFFASIELFVLAIKLSDETTDYEDLLGHQSDLINRKLKELSS